MRKMRYTKPETHINEKFVKYIDGIFKNVCDVMVLYRKQNNYRKFIEYHRYFVDSMKLLKKKAPTESKYNAVREVFTEWYVKEAKAFWDECQNLESQKINSPVASGAHIMHQVEQLPTQPNTNAPEAIQKHKNQI